MSYEESLKSITLEADASIGFYTGIHGQPGAASPHYGKQYFWVKVVSDHTAGLAVAGDSPIGVLQNKPQGPGHAATIAIEGVTNVMAAGAINAGDEVEADANGKTIAGAGSPVGVALETCAGADVLIPVLLK